MGLPLRILHLEDDPRDAELVGEALAEAGLDTEIRLIGTREEYVAALERGDFDVIISDNRLPSFDGQTALTLARERHADVPFIVVSGTIGEELAVQFVKGGATDYVLKGNLIRLPVSLRSAVQQAEERGQRKEAEESLRASEERYRSLFEGVPIGLFRSTPEGQILDANSALLHMLGYADREAFLATNALDLYVNPEDRERWRSAVERDGVMRAFEGQMRCLDGTTIWLRYNAKVVRDRDGRILHYEGAVEDITELKRAEEGRRASEEQYRRIVETATEGIWLVDDQGKTIFANQWMAEMLGSTVEGLFGASLFDFLDDEERETIIANIEWRRIGSPVQREVRFRRRDGTRFWTLLSASQVNDEKGLYVGVLVMIADITKRKLAEEALRQAEERYRALMEHASDGILILNVQGRILEANRQMEALLGLPRTEIIGRHPWDFQPPDDEGDQSQRFKEFLTRGSIHLTRPMRRGDGTVVSVEISGALVEVGGEQIVIAIHRDITERLRVEETVRQTEKLAAMGTLVAGVAHELNNPLSVVIGQAFLLRQAAEGGPLGVRAEKITQAAERSARIVRNFLALARQYPPERQQVKLNQIVQEAVELLAYPLRVDDVEVKLDLVPDLPVLWADPHQLQQILVNLITNAHHAMRETPPPRRLTLTTRFESAEGRVSLEVADTGPGIPPPVRARIFEPFFTTKPAGQGTGLGLSLCLGIIQEHRGTLQLAETPPGGGTTFRIELPVDPRTAAPEALEAEALPPVRGKSILVVDDEAEIAETLRDMLATDGHQVETAVNGVIALNKLRERNYDLILSDLKMPELDGPGLYREIERNYPRLRRRVIFITGDALSPETREFLAKTEVRSVGKPFALDEVRRVILQALQSA